MPKLMGRVTCHDSRFIYNHSVIYSAPPTPSFLPASLWKMKLVSLQDSFLHFRQRDWNGETPFNIQPSLYDTVLPFPSSLFLAKLTSSGCTYLFREQRSPKLMIPTPFCKDGGDGNTGFGALKRRKSILPSLRGFG